MNEGLHVVAERSCASFVEEWREVAADGDEARFEEVRKVYTGSRRWEGGGGGVWRWWRVERFRGWGVNDPDSRDRTCVSPRTTDYE